MGIESKAALDRTNAKSMIGDMRFIARFRLPLAFAIVMVMLGCSTSQRTELVSERKITMPARSADADHLWNACPALARERMLRDLAYPEKKSNEVRMIEFFEIKSIKEMMKENRTKCGQAVDRAMP